MAVKVYHRLLRYNTIPKKTKMDAVGWHTAGPTIPYLRCRNTALVTAWDTDHHDELAVVGTTAGLLVPDPFLVPA